MPVALHSELNEVFALFLEFVVVQPAARGKVGQQDACVFPGRGNERHGNLAAFGLAEVQRHRTLGLVQATPKKAGVVSSDGPAAVIKTAAQGVDADHVGAHLRQRHAAQRGRYECRSLHHAHTRQNSLGHLTPLPAEGPAHAPSGCARSP